MKTAAKVFIILNLSVNTIFLIAIAFASSFSFPAVILTIFVVMQWMFSSHVFHLMQYIKPSTGISVVVLIFCSLLGGIFLLCSSPEEYQKPKLDTERETIARLLQYKQLADNGIISEEQFLEIKQKISEQCLPL